jgi:hypothetical protein
MPATSIACRKTAADQPCFTTDKRHGRGIPPAVAFGRLFIANPNLSTDFSVGAQHAKSELQRNLPRFTVVAGPPVYTELTAPPD